MCALLPTKLLLDGDDVVSPRSRRAGRQEQALLKAIKQGKISAEKDGNGEWRIELVELFRVYRPVAGVADNLQATPLVDVGDGLRRELAVKDAMIQQLREQISELVADKADLREDRDRWQRQAEQTTRLLVDQRPPKRRRW